MKKLLAALIFFALSSAALAQSSYTFIDAGGTTRTVKSINCTPICPMTVPVDSAGVPIWGTAGAANSNVMSVQGIASGTPIPISVGTVTVTGTITANLGTLNGAATAGNQTTLITNLGSPFQAGASIGNTSFAVTQPLPASLNATVVGTGTFATQLTGATNNINNISGTITLPTLASTSTNQATEIASLATIATNSGAATPAGTNLIGKVGIDQTTPGTTNGVSISQIGSTTVATASGAMNSGTIRTALATDSPGIITLGQTTMSASVPVTIASNQNNLNVSPYPLGSTPYTASATGTTGATTATLTGASSVTTYICGFSIRANATAAATGNATVTGTITATLNFTQWTAPNASGLGVTEMIFSPCVPASAANTSVAVVSAAPGTGGVVSVTAWGYKL